MNQARLADILPSVEGVVRSAGHVSISPQAVERYAALLAEAPWMPAAEDQDLTFRGSRDQCANFALLSDALNFCFWSDQPWEVVYRHRTWTRTFAMLAGLLRAIERDESWLTAERWAAATEGDMDELFHGVGRIPLAERRLEILRETGRVLRQDFDGRFLVLVEQAGGDAEHIADTLAEHFPSFRDVSAHGGHEVVFLKRAQICAADLHRTWWANGFDGLRNMEALTLFADYRLPQLLRHERMLVLDAALAERIDRGERIEAGSPAEVEMRAATIWIGKLLCEALAGRGRKTTAWELDYELWHRSKAPQVTTAHHRTITHFY